MLLVGQTCIWPSWCHCHSLSLASVKSRLVLPFWYWLTRVDPEKGPLNGCVCVCINNNYNNHDNVYGAIMYHHNQSHCESSPCWSDACRLSAGWLPTLWPSHYWPAVTEEVDNLCSEFCVTVGTASKIAGILIHSRLKVLAVNLSWPSGRLWLYAGLIGSNNPRWLEADLAVCANRSSSSSQVWVGECFIWYRLTQVVPDEGHVCVDFQWPLMLQLCVEAFCSSFFQNN